MPTLISDSPTYLTAAQWAELHGVTPRQARTHARRIPGARRVGRDWIIPAESVKPERAKRGTLAKGGGR